MRDARTDKIIRSAGQMERAAIALLDGVGGDVEWWIFSKAGVGHLRVPVTPEEYRLVPPGHVIGDAGEAGPQRRRKRHRA